MFLSVVVPCFNEEHGMTSLHEALVRVLPDLADTFEVLLVDDGSSDGTLTQMREVSRRDPRFRYIALSRNFGKEAAMLAGLSQARGDVVALIDADLQHPPELLGQMIDLLGKGYDQVVARRTRTGDPALRKAISKLYYRMINKVVDVELEDGVGDFRVLTRRAVQALLSLGEYNRFSKGLFSWIGFDTATIDYENVARQEGTTKWTFRKLLNYGIDGVISFNNKPLRAAVYLGGLVTLVAFCYVAWVIFQALTNGVTSPGYVTIMSGVLGLGGLQLLFLGVIGEYLGRIYYESKQRPHFLVKESSGPEHTPVTVPLGLMIASSSDPNDTAPRGAAAFGGPAGAAADQAEPAGQSGQDDQGGPAGQHDQHDQNGVRPADQDSSADAVAAGAEQSVR
ncbi:glycosyltransferase family 2 protein [Goodfellowiella coeruleoviolacea]|uniref:Glycosyltransferase involved in cell wall bisynthesis n=1 Tax=Goodfellowiella coeruleoviolacea TaxID=334858 RepID=A0AAE3GBL5_9PSEU|nr:glycosyltransferase family 2 protein [Goodfellowiella coeruleoviolacea]MCP2164394.1 Glycosyltransferase involved in cell wall bisynthesis [Goodfellowiella coeruleoviolacea]